MADIAEMLKKTGKFDLSKMPVEDAEFEPLTPEGNPLTLTPPSGVGGLNNDADATEQDD